jgi:glycerol kinase
VLLNIGSQLKPASEGACSTIAWTHQGKATYCFEGIISYAAATIAWLKDQLGLISDPAETEAAALAVPDNGGVYLVPAFAGLSAPYWSPKALAAIVGMTLHTNRSHVIRAALESIAYQLRDVLEMMKSSAGVDLKTINADGGTTRNKFLMQFIADMTGLEVTAAQMPDCSPLGAALAGMLGMNVAKSFDDLQKLPREIVTYRPAMPPARALELYLGWKRAVRQVLAGTE